MPQHYMRIPGGVVHYSTTDAVFRTLDGSPITMEFHHFCGPLFSMKDGDGGWLPDEKTPEWDNLWRQFDGWWKSKGAAKYKRSDT